MIIKEQIRALVPKLLKKRTENKKNKRIKGIKSNNYCWKADKMRFRADIQ